MHGVLCRKIYLFTHTEQQKQISLCDIPPSPPQFLINLLAKLKCMKNNPCRTCAGRPWYGISSAHRSVYKYRKRQYFFITSSSTHLNKSIFRVSFSRLKTSKFNRKCKRYVIWLRNSNYSTLLLMNRYLNKGSHIFYTLVLVSS